MEIDYIPWKDEDGNVKEIELFIGDCRVILDKAHAIYLWEILDSEVNKIVYKKSENKPRPSKIVEEFIEKSKGSLAGQPRIVK